MTDSKAPSGADGVASVAAAVARATYQWSGTGVRLVRDGTVYGYRMTKEAVQSLTGGTSLGETGQQGESDKADSQNGSSWKTALGTVGSATYQWAGTGARLTRDGTVYCYQKSKNAIAGLTSSEAEIPSWGSLGVTAFAVAGAGTTGYLWLTAISSRAAKEALRASCIRNSLCAMTTLSLPIQRSTAVFIGTRLNNYIVQGIVPGLFTAWAVYDTYRLGKWAYNWYYYPTVGQGEIHPQFTGYNKIAA